MRAFDFAADLGGKGLLAEEIVGRVYGIDGSVHKDVLQPAHQPRKRIDPQKRQCPQAQQRFWRLRARLTSGDGRSRSEASRSCCLASTAPSGSCRQRKSVSSSCACVFVVGQKQLSDSVNRRIKQHTRQDCEDWLTSSA